MKDKSHLTAIARKTLPVPTRWLMKKGMASPLAMVLDYGCGKCKDINPSNWWNYDPVWHPSIIPSNFFDTIICNYVLCVLPRAKRRPVLERIQQHLTKGGVAYVSVRNDKLKNGWGKTSKGTYQGRVHTLKLPLVYECAGFRIYFLTKETKLA